VRAFEERHLMSGAQQSPDAKRPDPAQASNHRRTPLAGLVGILSLTCWPLLPAQAGLQCDGNGFTDVSAGESLLLQRLASGTGITKFSLIAGQCREADAAVDGSATHRPALSPDEPSATIAPSAVATATIPAPLQTRFPTHRAAQLDLYERGAASPNIRFISGVPASVASTALPGAPRSLAGDQRMGSLAPAMSLAGARWDIDPLLLHAIAHVESRHNPRAVSHAGARGVMQGRPQTARRVGMTDPISELFDADANVAVSSAYLKTLQKRFGNNLPLVLAAYNAGEGAVEKYGRKIPPYKETQNYVREVLATYQSLRSRAAATPGLTGVALPSTGQGPL